ncbi:MAG: GspH/FimT family pseudopilin [Thermodesulfobacteriota bacterium]|nr:GspH/FimT family pseudopilin [Thermodesulfobacteriota bacterium]
MIKMLKYQKGFSLIELLVIVAILGIISTIAIPNITAWIPKYRLKSTTRDIFSTLQLARMRAIAVGVEYQVSFDLNNETYYISKGNSSSGSVSWTQENEVSSAPNGIDIASLSGGLTNLHFHPTGSSSNGTTITINNTNGDEKKISILAATGRIKITQ